ncbi:hypothetical protein TWF718_002829 [Orbilia javanica]|uniref:Uncharacterized protein n=1 Tax=Orbilia javanica TaxID=47235 RepID=A0AAN8RBL1_9PEZI
MQPSNGNTVPNQTADDSSSLDDDNATNNQSPDLKPEDSDAGYDPGPGSWEITYNDAIDPRHTKENHYRAAVIRAHIDRVSAESKFFQDEVIATAHIQTKANIAATGLIYSPQKIPPPKDVLFGEYHKRPVHPKFVKPFFEDPEPGLPRVAEPDKTRMSSANVMEFYIGQYKNLVMQWMGQLETLPHKHLVHLVHGFATIEARLQEYREQLAMETSEELSFQWPLGPSQGRLPYSA